MLDNRRRRRRRRTYLDGRGVVEFVRRLKYSGVSGGKCPGLRLKNSDVSGGKCPGSRLNTSGDFGGKYRRVTIELQ